MPRKVTRLGEKIKYYLIDRGDDQQDLASALIITNSALSHKLSGKNPWSPHQLDLVSRFFGLNEEERLELYDIARECNALSSDYEIVQRPDVLDNTQDLNAASFFQATLYDDSLAPESTIDFADAEAIYRHQVTETYKDLSFSGLGTLSLGDIPADQIFVHLTLAMEKAKSPKDEDKSQEEKSYESTSIDDDTVSIKLAQALSKNVVIVGEPGAGKSTLLRWLAVAFARKRQSELNQLGFVADDDHLPIFIKLGPLSDYYLTHYSRVTPNWIETLPEYISSQQNFPDLPSLLLKQALRDGRCLLLLDGLDEIVDQAIRIRLVRSLAEITHLFRGNRLVISSRPSAVKADEDLLFPQFQHCQIADFDPPQLRRFFHFWYTADTHLPSEEGCRKADDLYAKLQDSPMLLGLATTPLIGTILLLLWRTEKALPNSRVQLYEHCCHRLIELWEKEHDVPHDAIFANFGWKDHLAMLACLAYAIHKGKQRTRASEEELTIELADFFLKKHICPNESSAKLEAAKSLRILGLRSGLFQYLGGNLYGFLHLSFQEYLAARHIAEESDPHYIDLIMEHLHEDWWREVHVLVIAHLISDAENPDKASNLMLTILNHYQPISRWLSMLDFPFLDVLVHRSPLSSLRIFILRSKLLWFAFLLLAMILFLLLLPWIALNAIILYICPVEWNVARLLEREYKLVVDGYLAAGFPLIAQHLKNRLYKHAQSLLWRYIYDTDKVRLSETTLDYVYSTLREHFKEYKQESELLIQKLVQVIILSPSRVVQCAAIESLGELGQGSNLAMNMLIKQANCRDKPWPLCNVAVQSLGKLGVYSEPVVDTLIQALDHQDWKVREAAARSMGLLGQTNSRIIEALINTLQKKARISSVDKAAIESLGRIGLVEPRILKELVGALSHNDSEIRQVAINELVRLIPLNVNITDTLISAVSQKSDWRMHFAAIDYLVTAGQAEPEIAVRLIPHINHSSSHVKLVVIETLIRLGNTDLPIEQVLCKLLTDDEPVVRRRAVEQLNEIGQVSKQTIEIVTQLLLNDPNCDVRWRVAQILGILHLKSEFVIEALIRALDDISICQIRSLPLLKFHQSNWQIDVNQLQKISLDIINKDRIIFQSYYVAAAAARSLGLLGQGDDVVVHALIKTLHNLDPVVRKTAATSLGALGITNDLVVSALIEALDDPYLDYDSNHHSVSIAAAESLVKLGKTKEVELWFSNFRQKYIDETLAYLDVQFGEALHLGTSEDVVYSHRNKDAIENLINAGVPERDLAYRFIKALKHKNKNVRIAAASGLGQLRYVDDNVVSALMRVTAVPPELTNGSTYIWTPAASAGVESLSRLPIEDFHQLKRVIKFLERHRRYNWRVSIRQSAFDGIQRHLQERCFPGYRWMPLPIRRTKRKRIQFIRNCLLVVAVIFSSIYGLWWFNYVEAPFFAMDSIFKFSVLTALMAIVAQLRSYMLRDL